MVALLQAMKDVRGSVCFETCETEEFRYSQCMETGLGAPVLCIKVAKYVLWKAERQWKAKMWGILFGGEGDDQNRFCGTMWADTQ